MRRWNKVVMLMALGLVLWASAAVAEDAAPVAESKLGWRLCMQAYTYRAFTFFEAVDKTAALGIRYIEAYPRQKVSKDLGDATMSPEMSEDVAKAVREKLAAAGVKLVNFGVVPIPGDEAGARKVFAFAKSMGIETLVSEPAEAALEMLDKLCEEYGVNIAIHNHPAPTHYWSPETVLKACQGRGKRIGSCSDTGHWARSGLDPVECLKKLEGRIVSLHIKDVEKKGGSEVVEAMKDAAADAAKDAAVDKAKGLLGGQGGGGGGLLGGVTAAAKKEAAKKAAGKKAAPKKEKINDVPWGTGVCNMDAVLAEIKRQGLKGVFSIEYENQANLDADLAKCVEYWNKKTAELAQ